MREIVLDTETTGLDPLKGDRLVELGCVELLNRLPTGQTFHRYFNPERAMPEEAAQVHGLTAAFLADKPFFSQEVDAFLAFIGDAPLVIHNAPFDMGFLNEEMRRAGFKKIPMTRIIDTLPMARRKFPGAPASLDALCKRFGVDLSARDFHGALLDARLLAEVYLELCGGRQPNLDMTTQARIKTETIVSVETTIKARREPRPSTPSKEEIAAHESLLAKIKNARWKSA